MTDWINVPKEPTPEMLAAACVAVLPDAAKDIELARKAAQVLMMRPDYPGGSIDEMAGMMATMIPYYRAMIAAAPKEQA